MAKEGFKYEGCEATKQSIVKEIWLAGSKIVNSKMGLAKMQRLFTFADGIMQLYIDLKQEFCNP